MYILTAAEDDYYESERDRADDFLFERGYGLDESGAILYLIDMYHRNDYISTAGTMIDLVTDSRRERIFDNTVDYLRSGEFFEAARCFAEMTGEYALEGIPDGQYRYDEETGETYYYADGSSSGGIHLSLLDVGIALVLAAAGFFLPLLIVKGKYQLKGSTYSYDYRSNARVNITDKRDTYLRTTVVRTPKPQHDSSSFDSGSSTHTSSGGGSFGGGGGRGF